MRPAVLLVLAACGSPAVTMPGSDATTGDAAKPAHVVAYISGYGPAIAWFDVDLATGALTEKGSLAAPQPSYLALAAGHAYAVSENLNRVAAYAIAIASDGSVTLASHTPSGGTTPRMFALDPTGRWLFAANQGSDTVVAFAIDATAGTLTATGAVTQATMPAFVGFVALP